MKKSREENLEFAPLRSLNDFLLESARFQIPQINDLEKWGNRINSNLLYYQTNYFLLAILIFIIVGLMHPIKMATGFLTVTLLFMAFIYITNEKVYAANFKKNHPIIAVVLIFLTCYTVAYMLRSVLVFFIGIILPLAAIFTHASLRLRNLKNKLVNKSEMLGLNKRTPMGIFLEEMGLVEEANLF